MMKIKQIFNKIDILEAQLIHKESFGTIFSSNIDQYFGEVYYNSIANDKYSIMLGHYTNDKMDAFCVATTQPKGFSRRVLINNFSDYFPIWAHLLLADPSVLKMMKECYYNESANSNNNSSEPQLICIATSVKNESKNICAKLLIKLNQTLEQGGFSNLSIDKYYKQDVINMYNGIGAELLLKKPLSNQKDFRELTVL